MQSGQQALPPQAEKKFPTVLVVEDEPLIRLAIGEYLSDNGFRVLEAASVDEAIHMLEHGAAADVVFSDVRTPGELDGFGLAQWLKIKRPQLPLVLTSGHSGQNDATNRGECGNCPIFSKPYDLNMVAEHLTRIVAARLQDG